MLWFALTSSALSASCTALQPRGVVLGPQTCLTRSHLEKRVQVVPFALNHLPTPSLLLHTLTCDLLSRF